MTFTIFWRFGARLFFQSGNFAQATQMPLGMAEFGRKKGFYEIPGDALSDRSSAHTQDVHMVILNSLRRSDHAPALRGPPVSYLRRLTRRHHCRKRPRRDPQFLLQPLAPRARH